MPKSPRTKMREYRERMTEAKKAEARERNKAQAKKYRDNMNDEQRKAEKVNNTIRKRKARLRAKQTSKVEVKETAVFSSAQSEGKALRKVIRSLPASPRRKVAVLKKLAVQHGILTDKPAPPRRNLLEAEELSKTVKQFYESDDVSRQCAGQRDFVTVKLGNEKQRVQKRVMLMTVMEAFQQFKKEHLEIKIGKSKFASLRPEHVVPVCEKDHNVCCCVYHENFQLLLEGLKKINSGIPSPEDLIKASMCEDPTTLCSLGKCQNCQNVERMVNHMVLSLLPQEETVSYLQWNKQSKEEQVESYLDDLKAELVKQLSNMRVHTFVAKCQLHQLKLLKNSLKSNNTAILQEDFAENFAIKQQDEIMTAHWHQAEVTIFTVIVYFSREDYASFALVSDCLDHDKYAVTAFNRIILHELESAGRKIEKLHVFSDGCGGQFKNCSDLSLLTQPAMLHADLKQIDWSFFATSHGKGPIDGIGGTVKRAVWRQILRGNVSINTAQEFANEAQKVCPNVNVIFVSKDNVSKVQHELEQFWRENQPKTIPETRSYHYFCPSSSTTISAAVVSPFSQLDVETKILPIFKSRPAGAHPRNSL